MCSNMSILEVTVRATLCVGRQEENPTDATKIVNCDDETPESYFELAVHASSDHLMDDVTVSYLLYNPSSTLSSVTSL